MSCLQHEVLFLFRQCNTNKVDIITPCCSILETCMYIDVGSEIALLFAHMYMCSRWYHPGVSRHIAESILIHPDISDGTYLMRDSTNSTDSVTLSVR